MKKFSDFGIEPPNDSNMFQCDQIRISQIINCEITVLDFVAGVKTKHGDNRYVVKIKYNEKECKFFTNAAPIKNALEQIPKEEFPFQTIIKQISWGSSNTYQFT